MTPKPETIVLNHQQIALIIERMAHEIYETHHTKKSLTLVGISGRGYKVAQRILNHLELISSQKLSLEELKLDKLKPNEHPVEMSTKLDSLKGGSVILIDDVLNSGLTLVHALRHLLSVHLQSITTLVLVDRIHRRFPVRADIVGLTLSTTLQERVEVNLGQKDYAYLV